MFKEFQETIKEITEKAAKEKRLIYNPNDRELRAFAESESIVKKTIYGNIVAQSEPTSRAAMFTKNNIDSQFGKEELNFLKQAKKNLATEELIIIERIACSNKEDFPVQFIVPKKFAHLALGGGNLFYLPKKKIKKPYCQVLFFFDENFEKNKKKPLPEKDITIRLAMSSEGRTIKIVRNSNYIGELKKGVFAAKDWRAKKEGKIFLHAGCRKDYLQSVDGQYKTITSLILALSANGKTTLTTKVLARKEKEESWQIQDDGGTLTPEGNFLGFEGRGCFVKTEKVNPENQREIYYGLLKPETVGENIYVKNKHLDFFNVEKTSNGRAVILRRDIMNASPKIYAEKVDNLILVTRGPLIPAISKLTIEQATAFMVIGQAMESSAGDPTKAGKIRSTFFYDPFMAGSKIEHTKIFYNILKNLPYQVNCYLINTGGIGEGEHYQDIRLEQTLSILDSLLRGGLRKWEKSPTGLRVPRAVRGVDDIYFHPELLYTRQEFQEKQKKLNRLRIETIEKIGGKIINFFK